MWPIRAVQVAQSVYKRGAYGRNELAPHLRRVQAETRSAFLEQRCVLLVREALPRVIVHQRQGAIERPPVGLHSLGMDPSAGYLHADIPGRDSLSLDVLECIRPDIERWAYDWFAGRTLSRSWFHELPSGECRMDLSLLRELSGTARLWRAKIAPVCEGLTEVLDGRKVTPLSNRRMRESHGSPLALRDAGPQLPSFCAECGAAIAGR